ncbi:MAG: hypothetical protein ACK4UT_04380 [Moraxellaceae bacterium]
MKPVLTAAFCATLALGAFTASIVQADDKRIVVVTTFEKTTEEASMTGAELGALLKELGIPDSDIPAIVAASQKDGRLTLQAELEAAPAAK